MQMIKNVETLAGVHIHTHTHTHTGNLKTEKNKIYVKSNTNKPIKI